MRRPLELLLLGIAIPGALSPVLWTALSAHDDPREERIEVRLDAFEEMEGSVEAEVARAMAMVEGVALAEEVRVAARAGAQGEACRHGAERTLRLEASAADLLAIQAGSGSLEVEGVDGARAVEVTARLCASSEDLLQGLDVSLEGRDGRIALGTRYPSSRNGRGNRYARIDLTVRVPRAMAADIDDSSGSMRLTGLGSLTVDDSSGDIEIRDAAGPVRIDDSSGGITVGDVAGDVEVEDGSGEMEIVDVAGSVRLSDGSGSIRVAEIDGNVHVVRDGSGGIDVSDVVGDLVVERDGSGGIRHARVQGRVDVPVSRRR